MRSLPTLIGVCISRENIEYVLRSNQLANQDISKYSMCMHVSACVCMCSVFVVCVYVCALGGVCVSRANIKYVLT